VTDDALGLVTMVGLVTIAASTYMITYSHQLYALFEPLLGVFERKGTPREPSEAGAHAASSYKVIIFGLGRFGTAIGLRLKKRGIRVLGVDFNPQAVRRWRDLGLEADFGDATDPEFVPNCRSGAEWMVSTVPIHPTGLSHEDTRRTLIQDLEHAVALVGEEVVGGLDVVELVVVGDERPEVEAAAGDDVHQAAHALLAAGAQRGDDLVVAEAGVEGGQRDLQVVAVDAEAGQRAAGLEHRRQFSKVDWRPSASMALSTPRPPVSAMMASTGSVSLKLTTSSAPSFFAMARRSGTNRRR
jgi:hypothetical protein